MSEIRRKLVIVGDGACGKVSPIHFVVICKKPLLIASDVI